MKVKFGAIVVDGRNKIGGHVMSKNRAGSYMRTKVTPVNPRSVDQQSARARLAFCSSAWSDMDPASIKSWNSAVFSWSKSDIFGDIKHPSGFNLHQKVNNNILRVGGSGTDTPPVRISLDDLGILTIGTVTASAIPLTFTLQALGTNEKLEILATPPVSVGKTFVKSEYRIIGHTLSLTTGACDAGTLYMAKFGGPIDPSKPFFIMARIVDSTTGQVSVPVSAKFEP